MSFLTFLCGACAGSFLGWRAGSASDRPTYVRDVALSKLSLDLDRKADRALSTRIMADITHPISPFIVGPSSQAPFQTIQSAIEAAELAGEGTIYIQPGTYKENLTFSSGKITLCGAVALGDQGQCEIIGCHTPPKTGALALRNVRLTGDPDIFASSESGDAHLVILDAMTVVRDGYTFNLPHWTGVFELFDLNDSASVNNGVVNNYSSASFFSFTCSLGAGDKNPLVVSGKTFLKSVTIDCPVEITGEAESTIDSAIITKAISIGGTSKAIFHGCHFLLNLEKPPIIMHSTEPASFYTCVIQSLHSPVIDGIGKITLGNVTFNGAPKFSRDITLDTTSTTVIGKIQATSVETEPEGRISAGAIVATSDLPGKPGTVSLTNTYISNDEIKSFIKGGFIKVYTGETAAYIPVIVAQKKKE